MIQCMGPTNISSENSLINVYSIYLVKFGISRSKKISRHTFQNHLTAAFFLQTLIARFGSNLIGVCVFQARIFSLSFFFSTVAVVDQIFREQYIRALFTDPQTSLFNNFFIKNESHGIIHTFKNYFATVFSVFNFSKISSIQMDPKSQKLRKIFSL